MFGPKQKKIICIVIAVAMIVPVCISIAYMFIQ